MIWYVCFHPKRKQHWWARQYGHVSLAGYDNETWINVDLQGGCVDVRAFHTYDEWQDYLSFMLTYSTMLKFGPANDGHNSRAFLEPMTCVSFVKHTLGLRTRALLPDGLFRHLVGIDHVEFLNESAATAGIACPKTGADPGEK